MAGIRAAHWSRLEQWSPSAFIVGGVGILTLGVVGALDVAAIFLSPGWLHAILMLGGLWFVFIGLVGLYPTVVGAAPRGSLVAVVTSMLGWIALTVAIIGTIIADLATQRTFQDPGAWAPPFLAGSFILVLFGSLLYGFISVRSDQPSRSVGFLLFVPFVAILGQVILLVSKIVTGDVLPVVQLSLAGVAGLAIIAIGYLLRVESSLPDGQDSAESIV